MSASLAPNNPPIEPEASRRHQGDMSLHTGPSLNATPAVLCDVWLNHPNPRLKEVCSVLHHRVFEFREAHGLNTDAPPLELLTNSVEKYPVEMAPSDQREAIKTLSDPELYKAMRHGWGYRPAYDTPVSDESLVRLSDEIRAALTWKTLQER